MVDAVETMAWAGETPWHGLGDKVSNNLTPEQMVVASKTNWLVEKRELFYKGKDGEFIKVPQKFGLTRDIDDRHLSIVGQTWKPVQNADGFDFFKKFVTAGKMKMETAGSLHDGKYVWALARIGSDFKVHGDEMRGYLLLCIPHVFGKAFVIKFTPIRVVCWNTLTMALGASLTGERTRGGHFHMPHSMEFDSTMKEAAEESLGIAKDQMTEFKQVTEMLTKVKVDEKDTEKYFAEVLRFDAEKEIAKRLKDNKRKRHVENVTADMVEPRMLNKLREAFHHGPGAQLTTARGTLWGAVNAVTFVVDHELGRDQSASLRTAWLGGKAALKRRALDLAVERAA